jgi:hypothetical protein
VTIPAKHARPAGREWLAVVQVVRLELVAERLY